jgi:hypothetical protein
VRGGTIYGMSFTPGPNEYVPPASTPEAADAAAQANSLDVPAVTGEVVGSTPGAYLGYALRETSGSAAAKVVLYDNASAASGDILDEISLASGAVGELALDRPGRQVVFGIYAVITGAISGAVFQ